MRINRKRNGVASDYGVTYRIAHNHNPVDFRLAFRSLTHCSAVLEGVVRFYNGRGTAVMFVTMKPTRGRRDGHGHRRTVRLHHARRPSPARIGAGPEPIKALVRWTRGGLEPRRCSCPARYAAPTIAPTIFWSDRLAADAGPGRRRSQLPRIQPDALEAPDFVGIGAKTASQDGRRGRRNGGVVLGYLASWHDRGPCGRHDDGARSR